MKITSKTISVLLTGAILTFPTCIIAQTPIKPDSVLVSNARTKITYEDFLADLERLPEENRMELLLNGKRVAVVIENLLINKVMSEEAQRSGLQNNPKAAAEIQNLTNRVLTKYRQMEIEASAPKVDLQSLAREIYLVRLKDLERPALYTSWHTLIKTEKRNREAALELAKLVKTKVDAGERLDVIAMTYSEDESKLSNQGYIEPTPLSVLDGGFAKALEKLKPGESALVETEYGVHVVRLLKMAPRVRPSFEDIKPLMLVEAEKTYRQRFLQDYLTKIKSDPTIKVHTEVLDQIRPKLPEIPPPATAATR